MIDLHTPVTFVLQVTKLDIVKLLLPAALSFMIGILITPLITHYMYKYEWWRKKSVGQAVDGRPAPLTEQLNKDATKHLPRMGGLVVWLSTFIVAGGLWYVSVLTQSTTANALNLISREQTWMPLVTFVFGMLVGLLDDLIVVGRLPRLGKYVGGGLSVRARLLLVAVLATFVGWWLYDKQDITSIHLPFWGDIHLAVWAFIPLAIFVMMAMYASSNIDGVDGLSGGVFAIIYAIYGLIAFLEVRYDLAALCFAIVGGLLAFLWFNIPPARFMLSDSGAMPLTIGLAIIAFVTNTVALLPLIGLPLVVSIGSVILQILSKKFRGKKVFLVSPLHNHLRLKGWPDAKVVMRYWVITAMCAAFGLFIFLTGGFL